MERNPQRSIVGDADEFEAFYERPAAIMTDFGQRETGDGSQEQLQAMLQDEIVVATANVACIEPYTSTYRDVVVDRFADFQALYDAALATGAKPTANG